MGLFDISFGPERHKRKKLSTYDRDTVTLRQKSRCAGCGRQFTPRVRPQFDHKRSLASGGSNRPSNFRALCPACHDVKSRRENSKRRRSKADNPFGVRLW